MKFKIGDKVKHHSGHYGTIVDMVTLPEGSYVYSVNFSGRPHWVVEAYLMPVSEE